MDSGHVGRRYVRDLAALSALSAVWSRSAPDEVAAELALVVWRALPLAFVYVCAVADAGAFAEAAYARGGPMPPDQARALGATLRPLLQAERAVDQPLQIADPFGSGTLRVAVVPIGVAGDCGCLAAASKQTGFPGQIDRLLLGVAANQAAVVLEHKRLEAELQRGERELADSFDNAPIGVHWVGPDGTIVRANRAEIELLGYARDDYVGHHIAEFHVDRDMIDDMLRRLHAGEDVRDREARVRCRDGSIRHVVIDANVLWDEGRFVHTRCFTRDITEQKRAQFASAWLGAIVESSDDAIISKDLNGIFTSWNKSAERLFGYSAEEALGRSVTLLIPEDRLDEEPRILERLRRGERVDHFETIRRRKDGTLLDISLTVSPIRDASGRIVGASKIARDITGRKRAEEALQNQTRRLQLLWEAASVLLTADDPDALLRELFAKLAPHLNVDVYLNYLVNDAGDALRLASCEGIPVETAQRIARLEFGQAICGLAAQRREPIVATRIQRSHEPRWQLVRSLGIRAYACHPLVSGDRLLGTLSFASRKRDEFDRDDLTLLQTVCRYVTIAYERLQLLDELRDAGRRKDEFLATLAHELRNPLAPLRNAGQVLRLKAPVEPDLRWCHDVIERQIEHLTRLIDDLLDVARITRNKLELRRERIELADVITGAVGSTAPLIEQAGHRLTVTLPPEPIHVDGDLVRLTQVFVNLLSNAAKYTDRGGQIDISAERRGTEVTVRVRDNGVGIPPDKLPRVFEMFFQIDRASDRCAGGLGIGLSLVRRLVEMHGGTVEAHSAGTGQGCEFVVRLPVLPLAGAAASPHAPAERRVDATRRILVVDDNRDAADSLAIMLRLTGNEVETAYDGIEGLEAVQRLRPSVVLLDIGMPKMSGDEAARRIRGEPWGRDIVLIALTGWGQNADRRRTLEAGFDFHMVKPVDPVALTTLLASLPFAPELESPAR